LLFRTVGYFQRIIWAIKAILSVEPLRGLELINVLTEEALLHACSFIMCMHTDVEKIKDSDTQQKVFASREMLRANGPVDIYYTIDERIQRLATCLLHALQCSKILLPVWDLWVFF
jgi:hypothetical protein